MITVFASLTVFDPREGAARALERSQAPRRVGKLLTLLKTLGGKPA